MRLVPLALDHERSTRPFPGLAFDGFCSRASVRCAPCWLGAILLATACSEEVKTCDDVVGFREPTPLATAFARVEFGPGSLAVLWETLDEATQLTTSNLRLHGLDGTPLGSEVVLSTVSDFAASTAATPSSSTSWAVLISERRPDGGASMRMAELTTEGLVGEPRSWLDLDEPAVVYALVPTASGYAALWYGRNCPLESRTTAGR